MERSIAWCCQKSPFSRALAYSNDFLVLNFFFLVQVSFLFSDRGTPDGYRHMNGYGSHTFKNVNAQGHAVRGIHQSGTVGIGLVVDEDWSRAFVV